MRLISTSSSELVSRRSALKKRKSSADDEPAFGFSVEVVSAIKSRARATAPN